MKTGFLKTLRNIKLTGEQKEECRKILDAMDDAYDDYDSLHQVLSFAKEYSLPCWQMHFEMFKDNLEDEGETATEDDCFEDWMDLLTGDFRDYFPQIQKEVCLAIGAMGV